jgi:hypothetical protein
LHDVDATISAAKAAVVIKICFLMISLSYTIIN